MAVYTAYLRKHSCPRRSISTGFNFDVHDKLLLTPYSGHVSENELNFTRIPVFAPSRHFIVNVLHYCLMFSVCSSRDCQITVPDPKIARGQWSFSLWRKLLLPFWAITVLLCSLRVAPNFIFIPWCLTSFLWKLGMKTASTSAKIRL